MKIRKVFKDPSTNRACALVCKALLLRLAVFQALLFLPGNSGALTEALKYLHALSSVVLTTCIGVSFFDPVRRSIPRLLLWTVVISQACQAGVVARQHSGVGAEDDNLGLLCQSTKFLRSTLDSEPTSLASVPLALLYALRFSDGSSLRGILTALGLAAVFPTIMVGLSALWAGLTVISWSSLLRSTVAGASSTGGVFMLLWDMRKLAKGRSLILNDPVQLPEKRSEEYLALRALTDYMLAPILAPLATLRTCVWCLSFGKYCGGTKVEEEEKEE